MSIDDDNKAKRIAELLTKAQHARRSDANQEAADAVREALSIDPSNEDARKLFEGLSVSGSKATDVLKLCREYHEGAIGDAAFRSQLEASTVEVEGTRETLEFAFEHKGERGDCIVEALLDKLNGKRALIPMLLDEPNRTFKALWDLGERSLKAVIMKLLLQAGPWSEESQRRKAEKDMLLLLLAKLLQAGLENPELAMLAIARLLAVDVAVLQTTIDSDAYMVFFDALHQDNSTALRSQSTLSLAKLYEAAPDRLEPELLHYVESMAKTQWTDKLVNACSAVSTLFSVATQICAKLFLKEGFLQQLLHLVSNTESESFREATLELFSAACIDTPCRQAVQKHCADWLGQMSDAVNADGSQSKVAVTAALVNSKIREDGKKAGGIDDKLLRKLKNVIHDESSSADAVEKAIEALQYQSMHAKVKEDLTNDMIFLRRLIASLSRPSVLSNGALIYVGLTIFQNLTRYPPVLSTEQQRIAELRAYANRTPLQKTHPLDEDEPVTVRCRKVVEAGIAPLLVKATKKASLALHLVISSIIVAISKHPMRRGQMAQEGLFDVSMAQATIDEHSQSSSTVIKRQASLSVARIMIPINPELLMKGRDVKAVVRILHYLLKIPSSADRSNPEELWWCGFPVKYALEALTNLASYSPSDNPAYTADYIVNNCWPNLEDLWVSSVPEIRTAVTECFVNILVSEDGLNKFITDGSRSERRMRILVGYWSEESGKLAAAAGGALATILFGGAKPIALFMKTESGIQSTVEWLESGKKDMIHRAIMITKELLDFVSKGWSQLGDKVLDVAKNEDLHLALQNVKGTLPREMDFLDQAIIDALQILRDHGC